MVSLKNVTSLKYFDTFTNKDQFAFEPFEKLFIHNVFENLSDDNLKIQSAV